MNYWILKTPIAEDFAFYYIEAEHITTPPEDNLVIKLNVPTTPQILEDIVTQLNNGMLPLKVIGEVQADRSERKPTKTAQVREW